MLSYPVTLVGAIDTSDDDIEYQIKAAYLYKFASHVEWPPASFPEADTPVSIGIVGADAMATELNKLTLGHLVNNRKVEVKRLKPGAPLSDIQILFIGQREHGQLKQLLDTIKSQPILTVTESPGALEAGSVINFIPLDKRIRFEVSVASAEHSGLKISARLLEVAQRIEGGRP
ncbi:MAG: YfiR family protein [Gammaproteobacteria bacterium]|nr:YfiR family protein [Gammaproteobacteria bacterium]